MIRHVGIHSNLPKPRLAYTVEYLAHHPLSLATGLHFHYNNPPEDNDLNIAYGPQVAAGDFQLKMPAQTCFYAVPARKGSFYLNTYDWQGRQIYAVEPREKADVTPLLKEGHFQADLLESIFFHISRYEEVFATEGEQGEAGWLREDDHLLVRYQLAQQPVVDQLIATFLQLITGQEPSRATTYSLTHDVDFLFRYPNPLAFLKALAGAVYRSEGFGIFRDHVNRYRAIRSGQERDPYDCFDWLLSGHPDWSRKQLYLMAGGETPYDNHYRPEHPHLLDVIQEARKKGYTIGLHPSYNAALKNELFREEKAHLENILGEPVMESRQHWLRFHWDTTPLLLEQHGIKTDASLGYRRRLGFRCGTGFPYFPYNFSEERAYYWLELPLACMESAAIHQAYREGWEVTGLLRDFLDLNRQSTHIAINFHNSNFDPLLPYGSDLSYFYQDVILALPA